MTFTLIDLDAYPRREHYERYRAMKLTYSATVQIDVTALVAAAKAQGYRLYPAQIWALTTAANRVPEFRMNLDPDGRLGVWERLEPSYTVLAQGNRAFSSLWTPYSPEFAVFHGHWLADVDRWNDGTFEPQPNMPPNVLNVSSIPWVAFTGFDLNLSTDYLLPILTIGKHSQRDGQTFMPLAVQVHHAVCDGWHLGQFVEQVEQIVDAAADWLR